MSQNKTQSITNIFKYLEHTIRYRLSLELNGETHAIPKFSLECNHSQLAQFIKQQKLSNIEIIMLLLALIPEVQPGFINTIISDFLPNGGDFPEFGGVKGKNHRGILPTAETALYILFGNSIEDRLKGTELILGKSKLFKDDILYIEHIPKNEPFLSGRLLIDTEYLTKLTLGIKLKPKLSQDFPASLIETHLQWDDLILKEKTIKEIKEIETWLKYNDILLNDWNMKGKIKPGYRVMFHGLPGTGKTMTAGLLGKYTNKDVYRIDLSMVVSKYIGETEKNLSGLFDKAINKNWILFFDEADSIFGKRTNVRDAHDKYANQEVSYLLQRIETHPELVILATNFKNNIDTAFTRRFQALIEFEPPTYKERHLLWQNYLPQNIKLADNVNVEKLAKKFALTGANIVNIVQYACLKTIASKYDAIPVSYLLEGIKKEYQKEGKTVTL